MKAKVLPANLQDRDCARDVLASFPSTFPWIEIIWADGAYTGDLGPWIEQTLGIHLELVQHPYAGVKGFWVAPGQPTPVIVRVQGFRVLPRRWVVERTFAWLGRNRRLSKDYEQLPDSEEAFLYMAMCRLMLHRLTA